MNEIDIKEAGCGYRVFDKVGAFSVYRAYLKLDSPGLKSIEVKIVSGNFTAFMSNEVSEVEVIFEIPFPSSISDPEIFVVNWSDTTNVIVTRSCIVPLFEYDDSKVPF